MMQCGSAVKNLFKVIFIFAILETVAMDGNIEGCFDCICRGKVHCGITRGFWTDAGKPTPKLSSQSNDFNGCINDYSCARQAMENYYLKFDKDCNGDGEVNCYDYARIHILGGYGCIHDTRNAELVKIYNCLDSN